MQICMNHPVEYTSVACMQMADVAEKAFIAFLERTDDLQHIDDASASSIAAASLPEPPSAHLPLGAAAPDTHVTQAAAAAPTPADPAASTSAEQSLLDTVVSAEMQPASRTLQPSSPAPPTPSASHHDPQSTGLHSVDMRTSPSTTAARAWAQPPVELTMKHVGFLGSLAHALVHLQKASEGLSLLRAAACIMRTNPPAFHMWFQGSPDPQVLHAHVLMDLVSHCTVCSLLYDAVMLLS